MKVVFISGPFRGPTHWDIFQNIRKAEALALDVWKAGAAAICPHTNSQHFTGTCPDEVWLEGDLEILKRCDALIVTPDWERSSGARAEVDYAAKLGLPVFATVERLKHWLNENP